MTDYSDTYDENLNHKGSLLNSMVDDGASIESLLAGVVAGNLGSGVFGAFDRVTGVQFGVDKASGLSYIQSRNFVSGSTGWRLDSDGNIEGQSGTFRGAIKTANSGQRITINDSGNNSLLFFDSTGTQVISIGTATATAMRVDLTATTTDGVKIFSTISGSQGFRYENSSNVLNTGMTLVLSGSTNNTGNALRIDHDGAGGNGIFMDITNAVRGIFIDSTSSGRSLEINNSGSGNALYILQDTNNVTAFLLEQTTTGRAVDVDDSGSGSNPLIDILCARTGDAVFIDKNNSGRTIQIDQDVNDSSNTIGIAMAIDNAGAGNEYAFEFLGSEYDGSKTGVTTVTGVIRILTSDGAVFIPVYASAS